jgi:hypothetical protein
MRLGARREPKTHSVAKPASGPSSCRSNRIPVGLGICRDLRGVNQFYALKESEKGKCFMYNKNNESTIAQKLDSVFSKPDVAFDDFQSMLRDLSQKTGKQLNKREIELAAVNAFQNELHSEPMLVSPDEKINDAELFDKIGLCIECLLKKHPHLTDTNFKEMIKKLSPPIVSIKYID